MRVLVSGGGTAGHIYPALTVADLLRAEGHDVAFVGTPDGLEARLVAETGVPFHAIRSRGFDRGSPLTLISSGLVALRSVFTSLRLLAHLKPDVVVGFGGYVSLPVGMAAVLSRTPLVLHEQNSVPGLANKVLSRWARSIGVTYTSSVEHLARGERARVTGNPVRESVLHASRERGRAALGLAEDSVVVLVFGGSRGAQHLNAALVELAPRLVDVPSLQVVHVAGSIEAEAVRDRIAAVTGASPERYRVVEYIGEMGDAIAAADLVIARAGATSIAELTAIGRAAILVPYPFATDDHQTGNARALEQAGGARVIADADLDDPMFGETVIELIGDGAARAAMAASAAALGRRDAAERVVALAVEASGVGKETR